MSHGPAHDLGRCAEDCILTTPAEYRELLALRVAFAAIETLCAAAEPWVKQLGHAVVLRSALAAALAPVRELRGDPQ